MLPVTGTSGRDPITLRVAGLRLRLSGDLESWWPALSRRYRPFAGPSDESPIRVELEPARRPEHSRAVLESLAQPARCHVDRTGGLELRHELYLVRVEPSGRRAFVSGAAHRTPIDALLRHLLAARPGPRLVVHGTLLTDGRRAWVGVGPSGAGKTTLAGLVPELAGCDELVSIERAAAGWRAEATPFWNGRPGGGRLESVFLLAHGPRHRCGELSSSDAFRGLLRETAWPVWRAERIPEIQTTLAELATEVPIRRLEFAPTPDIGDFLRELAA